MSSPKDVADVIAGLPAQAGLELPVRLRAGSTRLPHAPARSA